MPVLRVQVRDKAARPDDTGRLRGSAVGLVPIAGTGDCVERTYAVVVGDAKADIRVNGLTSVDGGIPWHIRRAHFLITRYTTCLTYQVWCTLAWKEKQPQHWERDFSERTPGVSRSATG